MTEITRKAGVLWNADSRSGSGISGAGSRVLYGRPCSYATRFESSPGTNSKELTAAAHAAYSVAFANTLKEHGDSPRKHRG